MKKGTCSHYNGVQNAKCEANINYLELVGGRSTGWVMKLPCWRTKDSVVSCDKRQEPTEKQISDHYLKIKKATESMEKVLPLIGEVKKEHKGKDWAGTKPCPVCGGSLSLSHTGFNGHVWGKCDKEGCVNWME